MQCERGVGSVAGGRGGGARGARGVRRARGARAVPRLAPAGRRARARQPMPRRHLRTTVRFQLLRATCPH